MLNSTFRKRGNLVAFYNKTISPTDAEWEGYIKACQEAAKTSPGLRVMVMTSGGPPSATQRARWRDAVGKEVYRAATVTDSIIARAVITAVSWFLSGVMVTTPAKQEEAYAFLEVSNEERVWLSDSFREMAAEIAEEPAGAGLGR